MKMEKSSGFIIYRKDEEETLFLLLKYPSEEEEYWGLPKGHIEAQEEELKTAKRELREETGLTEEDIEIIPEFRDWIKYYFKQEDETIFKIVIYFLAQSKKKAVKLSEEHIDYKWSNFAEVQKSVPFENTREIINKAQEFISPE